MVLLLVAILGPIIFIIEFPNNGAMLFGKVIAGLISISFLLGSFRGVLLKSIHKDTGIETTGPGVTLISASFMLAWLTTNHWSYWIFISLTLLFFFTLWSNIGSEQE